MWMASSLNRAACLFRIAGTDHHSLRIPIRGGSWNNTSNAGVFKLNLNNVRSNANGNIGRRSAFPRQMNVACLKRWAALCGQKGSGSVGSAGERCTKNLYSHQGRQYAGENGRNIPPPGKWWGVAVYATDAEGCK